MKPLNIKSDQNTVIIKYRPHKKINPEHQEFFTMIGQKIKELRKSKKISVIKLSSELGISRNAYSEIEHGRVYFNILSLLKVLDFHEINIIQFFKQF